MAQKFFAVLVVLAVCALIEFGYPSGGFAAMVVLPEGHVLASSLVLQSGMIVQGSGRGRTILDGDVMIGPVVNFVSFRDLTIRGHVLVIDSMGTSLENATLEQWGADVGLDLLTRDNPGGNGTYFTDLRNVWIDCQGVVGRVEGGAIGLRLRGVAAQVNRTRTLGLRVVNCWVGIWLFQADSFTAWQPEISGNQWGAILQGAGVTTSQWHRPTFEGNTVRHLTINTGAADNVFFYPTFAAPLSFGYNLGDRTVFFTTTPLQ